MGVKVQSDEYAWRGEALEDMNFWDFFLETYEWRESAASSTPGERQIPYLPGGPRKGGRRVRLPGHETLPQFLGQWFPSRRDDDRLPLHHASMLALFKPWRTLDDLKDSGETFATVFETFMTHCPTEIKLTMDNMEYYYLSAEAASIEHPVASLGPVHHLADMDNVEGQDVDGLIPLQGDTLESSITDEAIEAEHAAIYTPADRRFAREALLFAHTAGVFDANASPALPWAPVSSKASFQDYETYAHWETRLKEYMRHSKKNSGLVQNDVDRPRLCDSSAETVAGPDIRVAHIEPSAPQLPAPSTTLALNSEQQRAHDILRWHVKKTIEKAVPEQLLMIVDGQGGTGKSALITAMTVTMNALGVLHWLSKTATSGVAATRIGGSTAHSWAGIGPRTKQGGAASAAGTTMTRRKENMEETRYLFIDEFSMLTKDLLANLSEVSTDQQDAA